MKVEKTLKNFQSFRNVFKMWFFTKVSFEKTISRWGRNETQIHELCAESFWKGMHLSD